MKSNETYIAPLSSGHNVSGKLIGKKTAIDVKKVDVKVYSPTFSTAIKYDYTNEERGKTHAIMCGDVKASGSYQKREPGFFADWERSFTTELNGVNLPACRYSVTFIVSVHAP